MNSKQWERRSQWMQKAIQFVLWLGKASIIVEVHDMPDGKRIAGMQIIPSDLEKSMKLVEEKSNEQKKGEEAVTQIKD